MPQVDFYVLQEQDELARRQFACRLLEKIHKLGKSAVVIMPEAAAANAMDQLLWEFPPESFLPHGLNEDTNNPIAIRLAEDWKVARDVAINLQLQPLQDRDMCERLVEIVVQDPAVLQATREHFKFYRQQGYQIQSHAL